MIRADEFSDSELFKKMLTVSVIAHVSFFLVIAIKNFLIPSQPINLESAIRVDMVGLPDKITELPKKAEQAEAVKPVEKMASPKEKAGEHESNKKRPSTSKKKSALDRIKEFEREERKKKSLKDIEEEVKKQEASERAEKAKKFLVKGNIVNPGSALQGLTKAEFNEYVAELHAHIKDHWNLPEWLSGANLKATVVVHIDAQGNLIKKHLERSSGDERFDNFALKAVDDASPFPKPPEKFVDVLKVNGFKCGFPE